MKFSELLLDSQSQRAIASRIYGVVVGVVTNNQDPEGLGRVKVKYPWLSDEDESDWARIAVTMAGDKRGMYFIPEVNDEVLVAFEHGDVRFPYIIGALWNGEDKPPINNDDGENNVRMIKSRSGHVIRLNDKEGEETIEIVDKTEKNSIVFDTATNTIAITTEGDITLSASQGNIKLEAQNIEIKSSADTKVESGAIMDIKASSTMNLNGQIINLN
ncbi:MAG: phage tail protein [Moorea sp. SIO1F2]|uniref:phage baseplate assembly protein V n=1 Tax=unclassified Moorena TaxID=2683338 RepID=UPI0013BBDC86|nr:MULTISPECIES: phage baseplate assembly protein V [unclassified Moorena]NEP23516.1 phage tail protein [Moorena sp. SIO3I6]NET83389.1 phage tail protein [Moorena sp. SIO1F2]